MRTHRRQGTVVLSMEELEFLDEGTLELADPDDDLDDVPTQTWVRSSEPRPSAPQETPWWKAARRGVRTSSPSADTEKRQARLSWWEAARLGLRASDNG